MLYAPRFLFNLLFAYLYMHFHLFILFYVYAYFYMTIVCWLLHNFGMLITLSTFIFAYLLLLFDAAGLYLLSIV